MSLKRWATALASALVRLLARVVDFGNELLTVASRHGLDAEQELAWKIKPRVPLSPAGQWGAQDFLLLMDEMSGRRAPKHPQGAVRTSVVMPVFDKVEYTFQALRALIREVDLSETEIIVVNNASRDDTPRVLSYFDDYIRVVNNEENRGFVEACNQGAAAARGRYVVFLNNDTVVLEGWLRHMLDTVEDDDRVGAVGSMLVYPDGTIQEAGAGVWRNGAAYHYGWGKSPENRKYTFAREVDYCSGASLLVRKELFDRLGGFDKRYAPAYYEDVDLCFGIRLLGYKVRYQPMSRVIHYEGVTAGRGTESGFKHFQEINREKFVKKWRAVLEREHVEEDEAALDGAANRSRGAHVIVFDERVPTPDRDAGSARMLFILKTLAKWARPVFVPLSRPEGVEYEQQLWKEGVETATLVSYPRLLKRRNFSVAIISRPDTADAVLASVRRASKGIRVILDTVDLHFLRHEREHSLTGDARAGAEAARYRNLELRLVRSCDQTWCASSEDKKVLAGHLPDARIEVVPTIHPLRPRGKAFDERKDLLFIGNLQHRPNEDGLHYLMREIYPLVRQAIPEVRFNIVGGSPSAEIAAYHSEDVRVLGYVPDTTPLLESSRVFVAPLRFGAGIKGKIAEAMSYGLPVVTTSIGAEGMGIRHSTEALIADDPQAFADSVVQLYRQRDLWQRIADHAYTHIEKNFTPQIIGERLRATLKELLDKPAELQVGRRKAEG